MRVSLTREARGEIKEAGYSVAEFNALQSCPFSLSVAETIKWAEFCRAIDERDFAIGDTLWLNGVEFKVVNKERQFICPECGASFGSFDEAKQHSWYCGDEE